MTIVYQNRAMRAVRNCNILMPTSFTTELGRNKQLTLPGFVLVGELHGKERTFYVIEDQLFLVRDSGKEYHLGCIQSSTLMALTMFRAAFLATVDPRQLLNEIIDMRVEAKLRDEGIMLPEEPPSSGTSYWFEEEGEGEGEDE